MTLGSAFLVLLFAFAIAGMAQATARRQAYANAALCLLAVRPTSRQGVNLTFNRNTHPHQSLSGTA
jgi:hypothetical protein